MRFAATPTQPCSRYTTICIRSLYSLQHRGGTDSTPKRPPHPPHTGGTFHRRLQPLYMEKHQVSCSSFLPNTSPMQHSCSHYNAYCSNTYTSMQPLHHDLIHSLQNAEEEPIHRGGTFHRRLQPHYTEKHKGSCSGFLPNTSPMQHSCSHYMRFAAAPTHPCSHDNAICIHTLQNTKGEAIRPRNDRRTRRTQAVPFIAAYSHFTRTNTRFRAPVPPQHKFHATFMQPLQCVLQQHPTHPCSHYSAICIQTLQNTEEKPIRPPNDRSRICSTQEVPFIAACSHFTRKNARFPAPASSPTQVPCNIHAAITMRFAAP